MKKILTQVLIISLSIHFASCTNLDESIKTPSIPSESLLSEKIINLDTTSFFSGLWTAFGPEDEAILTYNLPSAFKASFFISISDNAQTQTPSYLTVVELAPNGKSIELIRGNTLLADGKGFSIIPANIETITGSWSIAGSINVADFSFLQYTSLWPMSTGKTKILDLDEPQLLLITYRVDSGCGGDYIYLEIDGQRPINSMGQRKPFYPSNTILTYGKELEITAVGGVNCPSHLRHKLTVKVADLEYLPQ